MPFEIFKTLTGNEIAVAFIIATITSLFFVLTGSGSKKVVVNPGTRVRLCLRAPAVLTAAQKKKGCRNPSPC